MEPQSSINSSIFYQSPVGPIKITGHAQGVIGIKFMAKMDHDSKKVPDPVKNARQQLDEYFNGHRKSFDVPVLPEGTPFQTSVWKALCRIPFGQVEAYGDVARCINNPAACRAVGRANGQNPIPIIIPCHRVIGKNGTMTGYASGVWRKEKLLTHEGLLIRNGKVIQI